MKRLTEFLNTQHSLSKSAKESYRAAILAFDKFSGKQFEDVYLDSVLVHETLNKLSEEYAEDSWNHYLVLLKRYAKWLSDPDDEVIPKFWKRINPIPVDYEKKLKDKWLTEEEFRQLLEVVDNTKDRAMYAVALEGALRVGELVGLKVRDVKPVSYGFDCVVSGKTGSGSFPIVLFAGVLRQWLNVHPCRDLPDAPLWPVRHGKNFTPIKKGSVEYNFTKYAKQAGINRHITIHILRHSRITWAAKDTEHGLSDELAKKMFRWKQSSRMYSRYTHLHGTDSTKGFLALDGVKENVEVKPSVLARQKCFSCGEENSADAMYCLKCGTVLDEEQAKRIVAERRMLEAIMNHFKEQMGKG